MCSTRHPATGEALLCCLALGTGTSARKLVHEPLPPHRRHLPQCLVSSKSSGSIFFLIPGAPRVRHNAAHHFGSCSETYANEHKPLETPALFQRAISAYNDKNPNSGSQPGRGTHGVEAKNTKQDVRHFIMFTAAFQF